MSMIVIVNFYVPYWLSIHLRRCMLMFDGLLIWGFPSAVEVPRALQSHPPRLSRLQHASYWPDLSDLSGLLVALFLWSVEIWSWVNLPDVCESIKSPAEPLATAITTYSKLQYHGSSNVWTSKQAGLETWTEPRQGHHWLEARENGTDQCQLKVLVIAAFFFLQIDTGCACCVLMSSCRFSMFPMAISRISRAALTLPWELSPQILDLGVMISAEVIALRCCAWDIAGLSAKLGRELELVYGLSTAKTCAEV